MSCPSYEPKMNVVPGLNLEEASQVFGTSPPTVMRDLRFAQAWLARDLS